MNERRIFSDEALQSSIDRALDSLPNDRKAAVLEVGADQFGIIGVIAVKLDAGWSVAGTLDRRFSGEWSGKVAVRWSGN